MESVVDGMESRPKTEDYKLSLDAIRGRAAMPYNAFGVDSIPSPSVLDKKNHSRFDCGFSCERATKSSISRGKNDQKYTLTFVPSLNLFNICRT